MGSRLRCLVGDQGYQGPRDADDYEPDCMFSGHRYVANETLRLG